MAPPTPTQIAWRHRIEMVIRLAQPALDLVLFVGDRVSRAVDKSPDEALPSAPPPPALRPGPSAPQRQSNAAV